MSSENPSTVLTVRDRLNLIKYDFWHAGPVDPWPDYVAVAEQALAAHMPVIIVSGRQGTGKTSQFGGPLERKGGYQIVDLGVSLEDTDIQNTTEPIIHIDEVTEVLAYDRKDYFLDLVKSAIKKGKQLVLVLPGATSMKRLHYIGLLEEGLRIRAIESLRLPDVSTTYVNESSAAELLDTLGVNKEVIELFNSHAALRAPRLFEALILHSFLLFDPEQAAHLRVEEILEVVLGNISGLNKDDPSRNLARAISGGEPYRHLLFETTSLSTGDSVELYELVGQPLPEVEEFSPNLNFDPYQKD